MKDWLSPERFTSYGQHRHFDVVGSDSGTVFRIHHGTQTSVVELDNTGQPVCKWCFVLDRSLVARDVMLTQKKFSRDQRTWCARSG